MNRNTTIALLLVFAALGLYVLLVQVPKDRAAAGATPTTVAASAPLWSVAADQITGVRVVDRAGNRSVAFSKDAQGAWTVTEPEAGPADAALVSSAATRFTNLFATTTITSPADLSAFGVLSPTYTIELRLADGGQLKADVGDKTPTGTSYYLLQEGQQDVAVVSSTGIESIVSLLDAPPYLVPTPTAGATVDISGTAPVTNQAPPATVAATATP